MKLTKRGENGVRSSSLMLDGRLDERRGAMTRRVLTGVLAVGAVSALADAPLAPPSRLTRCSPNRQFCALSDPKLNAVVGYRAGNRTSELWRVDGWERSFDVSNDGDHLVVCYSGLNLLPLDYKADWVMLKFYKRGTLLREWTLRELVPDLTKLKRTVSHYSWGHCVGFKPDATYEVETEDRGALRFDVSGRLVK